ncbi:MAG: hypothetical protein M1546_21410 [Chloroflexi bacterium]|nr:hypothetical protein [Chloroflexota bacterium]
MMNRSADSVKHWQGWLAEFNYFASAKGWREFVVTPGDDETTAWYWSAVYVILLQSALANAMLLACLQLPQDEAEAAIADIARGSRGSRFGKPPSDIRRAMRELYHESTRRIMRDLPTITDLFESVFLHYLHGEYDVNVDANLMIRDALSLSAARNRDGALAQLGRAGATALRGGRLWSGWTGEGTPEFRHWALSLTTMLENLRPVLPLDEIAAERSRAEERSTALASESPHRQKTLDDAGELDEQLQLEQQATALVSDWLALTEREAPLSDDEIQQMGDRYEQFASLAARTLAMRQTMPEDLDGEGVTRLAVIVLGMLRYTKGHVLDMLIELIAKQDELEDDEIVHNAIWALQQMGDAAIQPAFDFVRYSSLEDARTDMLQVLAVVGRNSDQVFNYLVQQFSETPWASGKARYALPLSLTHDARAVPVIVGALRGPEVTESDAWTLLDALQELNVTFYINHDTRAVNIPEYGIIEDVLPVDWRSRTELEEELAESGDDWDDDWDEDDDDDDDGDAPDGGEFKHDDYYDDVLYDEQGIPRCPDCGAEMHYIAGRWVHSPTPFDTTK